MVMPSSHASYSCSIPAGRSSLRVILCLIIVSLPGLAEGWLPALPLARSHFITAPPISPSACSQRSFRRCCALFSMKTTPGGGGFPTSPGSWNDHVRFPDVTALGSLLLTDKRSRMREVFDVELELVARAEEVAWGLWKLPGHGLSRATLRGLASARAQLRVLAGPFPSHLELIRGAVDLGLELGDDSRFTLHYERLERGPGGSESRPVEVACALTRCIKGGRPSLQGDLDARLVAVECETGFWLCVSDWSRSDEVYLDWRDPGKPWTFNAALDPDVSTVMCNVALSLASRLNGRDGEAAGEGLACWDPTCGSGTNLFSALNAGFSTAIGFDANPVCLQGAFANLQYFGIPVQASFVSPSENEGVFLGAGEAGVLLVERDSSRPIPVGAVKGAHAVVANLPFGRNYITGGGEGDVRAIMEQAKAAAPSALMCTVSGDDVQPLLEKCGYTVLRKAGSWNGKRYTFYFTVAIPRELDAALVGDLRRPTD